MKKTDWIFAALHLRGKLISDLTAQTKQLMFANHIVFLSYYHLFIPTQQIITTTFDVFIYGFHSVLFKKLSLLSLFSSNSALWSILTRLVTIAVHYFSKCIMGNFECTSSFSLDIQIPLQNDVTTV